MAIIGQGLQEKRKFMSLNGIQLVSFPILFCNIELSIPFGFFSATYFFLNRINVMWHVKRRKRVFFLPSFRLDRYKVPLLDCKQGGDSPSRHVTDRAKALLEGLKKG